MYLYFNEHVSTLSLITLFIHVMAQLYKVWCGEVVWRAILISNHGGAMHALCYSSLEKLFTAVFSHSYFHSVYTSGALTSLGELGGGQGWANYRCVLYLQCNNNCNRNVRVTSFLLLISLCKNQCAINNCSGVANTHSDAIIAPVLTDFSNNYLIISNFKKTIGLFLIFYK